VRIVTGIYCCYYGEMKDVTMGLVCSSDGIHICGVGTLLGGSNREYRNGDGWIAFNWK
jgi:hypothetical protein